MVTYKSITMNQSESTITAILAESHAVIRQWFKKQSTDSLSSLNQANQQYLYEALQQIYPASGPALSRHERELLYQLQVGLFGGLDKALQSSLERIGHTLIAQPDKRKQAIDYGLPPVGSVLVKDWKGQRLEVTVIENGFVYKGNHYASLSMLAKEIAGYAVSGPIFFGLRKATMKQGAA